MGGILLSKKHGVNPSLDHCFICGKDYAVVLFGKLKGDAEAPRRACTGGICDECQKAKDAGAVFLIEVDAEKTTNESHPWRTGRIAGVTKDGIRRMFSAPEAAEEVIKQGLAYLTIEAYEMLGIPELGEKKLEV